MLGSIRSQGDTPGIAKNTSEEERKMIETQAGPNASVHLRPFGNLDWIGAMSLRHVVQDALRPGVQLVIDLSRVRSIDAVGVSALVGSVRRVRAVGGEVQISNPVPGVTRRLELAGVYRLLLYCVPRSGNDVA